MREFAVVAVLISSISAGPLHPQQVLAIPNQPGQQISNLKVDSQGNLIVAAMIAPLTFSIGTEVGYPSSFPLPTSYFGLLKKIDPHGNEIFSRVLPGASSLTIAIDQNNDIYVGGTTGTPDEFPFTNILYMLTSGYPAGQGFLAKIRGQDGTFVYSAELGGAPPASSLTVRVSRFSR